METGTVMVSEMDIQKFWSRRIAGAHHEDETTGLDFLENQVLFPPAQVQVEDEVNRKSRPPSSLCVPCNQLEFKVDVCDCQCVSSSDEGKSALNEIPGRETVDGSLLGDIPCRYSVPRCEPHEMTAVGVYLDPRILPGFKYKIRQLSFEKKKRWVFGGEAREVESLGRGYSRRITLRPLSGQINCNPDYFWTDSNQEGFAFNLEVIFPQEKFTLFDADHQPVGHLELTQIQGPQTELSQRVLKDGQVEKTVRVKALCKVDWFHEKDNNSILPLSGVCLAIRNANGRSRIVHIRDTKLGVLHAREGYTLKPGTCSSLRSLRVSGANISDIPTSYTIVGIETHHLPVIGTYIDETIAAGFYYRVQLGGCGKKLFGGRALRLDTFGPGYAKRITFSPERLNHSDNHFWSDSHPEGFGFQISAVRQGMKFIAKTKDDGSNVGYALVFRDDCAPQVQLHHSTVEEENGTGIVKRVQIDVKCVVNLDLLTKEELGPHIMRVSGIATLYKPPNHAEASLVKIEDIGIDSQLNVLFFNQWQEIVFYPE